MTTKLLVGTLLHGSSFKTFGSGISQKPECGSFSIDPNCFIFALLLCVCFVQGKMVLFK